jgi:hypothetical protein
MLRSGEMVSDMVSMGLLTLAASIAAIIEILMITFRYVILCLLYVLGPLVIACRPYQSASHISKNWFRFLFEFAAWLLIMKMIQISFVGLIGSAITDNTLAQLGTMVVLVLSVIYLLAMISSYKITTVIMSGENMGSFGSALMAAGGAIVAKFGGAGAIAGGALKSLGSAAGGGRIGSALTAAGNKVSGITGQAKRQQAVEDVREKLKPKR